MRFYKQKRFYIPLFILLILLIIATALLYRPLKLIYWAAVDFPMEREKLEKIRKNVDSSEKSFNKFFKDFMPDTKKSQTLLDFAKTAKRDFMIARFVGLGDDYFLSYVYSTQRNIEYMGFAVFISLALKHNLSNPTDAHIQFLSFVKSQSLSYLQSTQELKDYLAQNNYFNEDSKKLAADILSASLFLSLLYYEDELCSLKEKDMLLEQMQQDYQVLQSIRDERMLQEIALRYGSYETMLDKYNKYITKTKERLNDCQ